LPCTIKKRAKNRDYDGYLSKTKIPGIRGAPGVPILKPGKWKGLAPAVSEPEGELPKESPYHYVGEIEVSDLNAMVSFMGTDQERRFVKSWSVFIDPTASSRST